MIFKRWIFFVTAVALSMSACTRHEGFLLPEQNEPLYTIAEAEKAYELARVGLSRSEATAGVLTLGAYRPDWSEAEISIDSTLYSADVPLTSEYGYYRYLEIEGEVFWIPLYPKLVTVTPPDKEHSSVYIRYYVPHEYYEWSHDPEVYDQLLNSLPKQDFTGLSLYTTLSGDPVCVARYERGCLREYGFLYDKGHTTAANAAIIRDILNGLKVGRVVQNITSRGGVDNSDDSPVIDGGVIDVVPIYPDPDDDDDSQNEPPQEEEWVLPIPDMGSGGSGGLGGAPGGGIGNGSSEGGENPDGTKSSKYNENITYEDEEIIEPLLDSIAKDCMGGTLLEGLGDVTIVTNSDRNHYNANTKTIYLKYNSVYGYRDYVFLEELIHAYQFQNQPNASSRALNNEIEAKVGWLLYMERGHTTPVKGVIKSREILGNLSLLAKYYQMGLSNDNEYFINQYDIILQDLQSRDEYGNYSKDDRIEAMHFDILTSLMIKCPEL